MRSPASPPIGGGPPALGQRWEHGSLPPASRQRVAGAGPDIGSGGYRFFATARGALAALVEFGRRTRGWERLSVPGYYCHDALRPLARSGVDLTSYEDGPSLSGEPLPMDTAQVVLVNNLFGLRSGPRPVPPGTEVIEDHTHDPFSAWASRSSATYCIASLRKSLPIPDGALLWSPADAPLPDPTPDAGVLAQAGAVYAAMELKRAYLDEAWPVKAVYRPMFAAGTEALEQSGPVAGSALAAALLRDLPVEAWREERGHNHDLLAERLRTIPGVDVLLPEPTAVPIGCTISVGSERRDIVRERLIARAVYPALLWSLRDPVVEVAPAEQALSDAVLTLQCDPRYGVVDLDEVADRVRQALR